MTTRWCALPARQLAEDGVECPLVCCCCFAAGAKEARRAWLGQQRAAGSRSWSARQSRQAEDGGSARSSAAAAAACSAALALQLGRRRRSGGVEPEACLVGDLGVNIDSVGVRQYIFICHTPGRSWEGSLRLSMVGFRPNHNYSDLGRV